MSRSLALVFFAGAVTLLAFWLLLQTPGSLNEALAHPFQALAGSSYELNSKLIDASESADSVRAASRRLLQPFGIVRLVRIYDASDTDSSKKR